MGKIGVTETRVSLAVSNSDSVRTTIPIHIAKKLGLSEGDTLTWDLDKINGRWIGTVRKSK